MKFWKQILPNIGHYELLSVDMKEFFSHDNLFIDVEDENFGNCLLNNEPKGGGKDFVLGPVEEVNEDEESEEETPAGMNQDMVENIRKAFERPQMYKNNFNWETDSEPDDDCIKVTTTKRPQSDDEDDEEEQLTDAFNAVLRRRVLERSSPIKMLTKPEIMELLGDPGAISDGEWLKKLPLGVQSFLQKFQLLRDHFTFAPSHDNVDPDIQTTVGSEIDVLEVPTSPKSISEVSTSSSNSFKRTTRSFSSASSQSSTSFSRAQALAKASGHSTPKLPKPRSKKKDLDGKPAANTRMQDWVSSFPTTRKRRRDSHSPS